MIKLIYYFLKYFYHTRNSNLNKPKDDVNGGVNCAVCTIVVTLVEEIAIVYNDTIEESLNNLCLFLPEGIFRVTCQQAVETFGPVIIDGFAFLLLLKIN